MVWHWFRFWPLPGCKPAGEAYVEVFLEILTKMYQLHIERLAVFLRVVMQSR